MNECYFERVGGHQNKSRYDLNVTVWLGHPLDKVDSKVLLAARTIPSVNTTSRNVWQHTTYPPPAVHRIYTYHISPYRCL